MSTQVLMPEPRGTNINWSQLSLVAVAGVAALSILLLLGMIIWMSLRTGVPGQPSDYSLKNYAAILADPYTYKVMWTTLYFSAVTIAVAVPLGIYLRLVGRAHRHALQSAGDEFAQHRYLVSDFSQGHGLGVFAPSAHRRDQYFSHAAVRSDQRAAQHRDVDRHRLGAGIDLDAAGLRDDLRRAAKA